MAKRTPRQQSKHDQSVKRTADAYKARGYRVKADIPGYKKPDKIGGHIPDVDAKKGAVRKIVEVETSDSLKKDIKQQEALKKYADKHGADFSVKKAK